LIDKLIEQFSDLNDLRCLDKVKHRLLDILVIAICAVIACAESWKAIALYGCGKLPWLRQFLVLRNGIPSHDTFRRVLMLIDPEADAARFLRLRSGAGDAAFGQRLGQRAASGAGPAWRGKKIKLNQIYNPAVGWVDIEKHLGDA